MLTVSKLNVFYGAIHAVHSVSLTVGAGELVSLIGANGAGKTTILHTITGLKKPTSGLVRLGGHDLLATPPNRMISLGLAHVPEGRRIFARMTVRENLEMGAYSRSERDEIDAGIQDAFQRFPRLRERQRQLAGTLSGGEQQMLSTARALMGKPRILLMDEPSMGLSPLLVREVFALIRELHSDGITILLVEQNARMALSIADRAYVLETGHIVMEGEGAALLKEPKVKKAYLGL